MRRQVVGAYSAREMGALIQVLFRGDTLGRFGSCIDAGNCACCVLQCSAVKCDFGTALHQVCEGEGLTRIVRRGNTQIGYRRCMDACLRAEMVLFL